MTDPIFPTTPTYFQWDPGLPKGKERLATLCLQGMANVLQMAESE